MATDLKGWVEQARAARGLSLQRLSETLGYTSKTSLERIMKERVRERSLETFYRLAQERLNLTEEERRTLARAVEVRLFGLEASIANQVLDNFLHNPEAESVPSPLILDTSTGAEGSLSSRYSGWQEVKLILLGCGELPIWDELRRLLVSGRAQVEHFMASGGTPLNSGRYYAVLQELIFLQGYSAFSLRAKLPDDGGIYRSNLLIAVGRAEDGSPAAETVRFHDGKGFAIPLADAAAYELYVGIDRSLFQPLMEPVFSAQRGRDVLESMSLRADWERRRALFILKPDLPFLQIPSEILLTLWREGVEAGMDFPDVRDLIHEREANLLGKREPTVLILQRDAMEAFARTGRMVDHWPGIRAFTLQERRLILRRELQQMRENPACSIYFLRGDDMRPDRSFTVYDKFGFLLTPIADEADCGVLRSVLVTDPSVVRMMGDYVRQHLIREHCLSLPESLRVMEHIAEMCREED